MSSCPQGYQPQEAQAIMKEVHSLRDAISSGEKEKQALIQVCDTHTHTLYLSLPPSLSRSLSLSPFPHALQLHSCPAAADSSFCENLCPCRFVLMSV